jgi:16S rRNA (guanine527-N7)-methyltransferase
MSVEALANSLHRGLPDLDVAAFSPSQESALLSYLALLQRWNRSYNLTAINDPLEMVVRHVLDSIAVLPWVKGGRLLDAGSGAGLPGIPLAIARPALQATLLDSSGKKIRFLNHVRRELALENIQPVQARLESYVPDSPHDIIISRAFSDLAAFACAARHLATAPTRLLAMKGRYPDSELDEVPDWVQVESVQKLEVPGLQADRHLVIMTVIP